MGQHEDTSWIEAHVVRLRVTKHLAEQWVLRWPNRCGTARDRWRYHMRRSQTFPEETSEKELRVRMTTCPLPTGTEQDTLKTKIEVSEITTQIQLIYPSSYKIRIWGFVFWILGSLKNLPSMMPSLERHRKRRLPKQGCEPRTKTTWTREISSDTEKSKGKVDCEPGLRNNQSRQGNYVQEDKKTKQNNVLSLSLSPHRPPLIAFSRQGLPM